MAVQTKDQSKTLQPLAVIGSVTVKIVLHSFLNTVKGIISGDELLMYSDFMRRA